MRAGIHGVLQQVTVEVGQQVAPGTNLARVTDPTLLKAEVRIAETQVRDMQIGRKATVDIRDGLIEGIVVRVDPAAEQGTVGVDVTFTARAYPHGARPELNVNGAIKLERLDDVVYMGRSAFGQEHGTVTLFELTPSGEAVRVTAKLGRSSMQTIEVLKGLQPGGRVLLSDRSQFDGFDRVRLG